MNITPEEFQERLNAKLKELTDFCAEYRGDAPELEATAEPAIKVACNFDLGNFPHGRRMGTPVASTGGMRWKP